MTAPGYAARAAAGAAFLDGQIPGWARQIELATLNLQSECSCVLGQLGGNYFHMRDDLHLSQDATVELGFALNTDDEDDRADWEGWAELDAAWAREIVTRREAAEAAS
jgi:hypothetical protein